MRNGLQRVQNAKALIERSRHIRGPLIFRVRHCVPLLDEASGDGAIRTPQAPVVNGTSDPLSLVTRMVYDPILPGESALGFAPLVYSILGAPNLFRILEQ